MAEINTLNSCFCFSPAVTYLSTRRITFLIESQKLATSAFDRDSLSQYLKIGRELGVNKFTTQNELELRFRGISLWRIEGCL